MATLEARILALEGGTRRGMCLACELVSMGQAPDAPRPACTHRPTTLARELAGMPPDNPADTGGAATEPATAGGA